MKKTRWRQFQTWTSNPADFLKRSSFVTLITVKLTSAAAPPTGPLLLLLPGSGARQGRLRSSPPWSDVSPGCCSKLAQPSVSVLRSQSTVYLQQHLDKLEFGLVWSPWVNLIEAGQMLTTSGCVQLIYWGTCVPFVVFFSFCLRYANLYANTAGQRRPI